ncbi:hypothetical protein [Enterococcus sp. LJL51]|uniref:hypothetical protein n=1 Tax=Enterococcus sp. LJL51 TaxID=3416656 RepID=UPI003CE7FADF
MNLSDLPLALDIAFAGVTISGILLLIGYFLKLSNGKFWSFPFCLLFNDADERAIGNKMRRFIFSYVPVFFVIFLILFLFLMLR